MGKGISGLMRPPKSDDAHPPYITVYKAAGGWQSQLVFWDSEMWDVWDTGGGPYGFESEARADATAWANDWLIALRLPDGPPSRARAQTFLEAMESHGIRLVPVPIEGTAPGGTVGVSTDPIERR